MHSAHRASWGPDPKEGQLLRVWLGLRLDFSLSVLCGKHNSPRVEQFPEKDPQKEQRGFYFKTKFIQDIWRYSRTLFWVAKGKVNHESGHISALRLDLIDPGLGSATVGTLQTARAPGIWRSDLLQGPGRIKLHLHGCVHMDFMPRRP